MQTPLIMLFVSSAAALGINCRGSGFCSVNDGSMKTIKDQVGVLIADGGRDKRFNGGGPQGSTCVFYQDGASGTAKDAYDQLQKLLDHGCNQCGSVPTQPGNDVSKGQLTVNFVKNSCCQGDCHC
ncbi:kp4 domain-containing protein [Hirsutella rhossiliensis]|uniref:Kp4 domain-containing protein n=1 Tax=Hirsutella rhossiliensis TaxID=111463 RepID=A0A9P8MQP4_9HYPO|nr:kp4 domain-containing protein [Hirsutella rhossiliensis]KAH0960008.1 kp4 domain-containing protein [Hirsutella rhossiliensis]